MGSIALFRWGLVRFGNLYVVEELNGLTPE
jgi:hypothetical protein